MTDKDDAIQRAISFYARTKPRLAAARRRYSSEEFEDACAELVSEACNCEDLDDLSIVDMDDAARAYLTNGAGLFA